MDFVIGFLSRTADVLRRAGRATALDRLSARGCRRRRRNGSDAGFLPLMGLALMATLVAGAAAAQVPLDPRSRLERPPDTRPSPRLERVHPQLAPHADLLRRVQELDRLLTLGSLSRAEVLLGELEQHSFLGPHLLPHRIRLAQLKGDHEAAVDLCREALADAPGNARVWRELAGSLLALGRGGEAREALDRFVATSPNQRSSLVVAVDLAASAGGSAMALALVDSARTLLAEPQFMARERALALLSLGREEAAADELAADLRTHPFHLPLVRTALADGIFVPREHERFVARLGERATEREAGAAERILLANLLVEGGDAAGAQATVSGLARDRESANLLLQNAAVLARELELVEDARLRTVRTDFLLAVLRDLGDGSALESATQVRALDTMASVLETALSRGDLGDDARAAAARFEDLLGLVQRRNPRSPHLYSAQIRLAHFTRDVIGEPARAAARLERLLTNLDLPMEGVALARLTLGETYLAAGDTARGRTVLTRLGKDADFREAAGHAHYHLARLDLAEGHWETARDRFAAVALDNPAATYANESLALGLAVAEELQNPTGGPALLELYAPAVLYDLTARPDSQRVALERFVTAAPVRVDMSQPQHLLERARLELAGLYHANGEQAAALEQLDRVVLDHPDGRHAAEALAQRGAILRAAGDEAGARENLERLLLQYPEYLFADEIRDHLRNLP
ncbi:MAG: tetratricopeptide repeat protein [Candidatus Krumholzibacteriia bacterium]